jgi:hypothetical protein
VLVIDKDHEREQEGSRAEKKPVTVDNRPRLAKLFALQ